MAKPHFKFLKKIKKKIKDWRKKRYNPHKSFKRSYREEYLRETEVPGILYHFFATFKILFKNWKLFLPLLIIVVLINIFLVGMMNEATYVQFQEILDQTSEDMMEGQISGVAKAGLLLLSTITTGGLSSTSDSGVAMVFGVVVFLIIWLTTIYLLRHRLAEHAIKLRDGLYNAMTPLISTFVVFAVILIDLIPIIALVIVYSAAVQTDFLATPFYALVFFIFAALMIIVSFYLLSSSVVALVAVTAPGLYPMRALEAASDLMMGRRIKFIIRLLAGAILLVLFWVIVMLPLILFDLFMKTFEWTTGIPFIPICLVTMTCFTCIFATAYIYLYYRWMLKNE